MGITIALEVIATTCMKLASTSPKYLVGVYAGYALCFTLFPIALRELPLSLAYATWSGVGTVASVLIGAACFAERLSRLKVACVALIVLGVVGLNLL